MNYVRRVPKHIAGRARHFRKSPLPLSDVIAIVKLVASAIQHAHEYGIIHCDLKPGNVLVDTNNKATVTDFGFAYMIADGSKDLSGSIGGTAGYIAPEVLQQRQAPTKVADIYGIGALLWALSVGTPPDNKLQLTDDKVPLAITEICARCIAANPNHRYQTVAQFLQDLTRCEALPSS